MIIIFCIPVLLFILGIIKYLRLPNYTLQDLKAGASKNNSSYKDKFIDYRSRMNGIFGLTIFFIIVIGILPIFFQTQIFSLFEKVVGMNDFAVQKDIALGGYGVFVLLVIALFPFIGKLISRTISTDLDRFTSLYAMDPLDFKDITYIAPRAVFHQYLTWRRIFGNKLNAVKKRDETFNEKLQTYNIDKVAISSFKKQLLWSSITVLIGGLIVVTLFNNYIVFTKDYVEESIPWGTTVNKISYTNIDRLNLISYQNNGKYGLYTKYDYALYDKNGNILLENTWSATNPNSTSEQNYRKIREIALKHNIPVQE